MDESELCRHRQGGLLLFLLIVPIVSGLDAVELVDRNGRVVRIGTDDPEKLAKVIRAVLRTER